MTTVIFVNILAVLFAFLARKEGKLYYLRFSFLVIFLFLALRYNYGNDYPGYLNHFEEINLTEASVFSTDHFEPGWTLLCRLFEPFGFFAMVAALAAFNCFSYYKFVCNYVPRDYYWFALFVYTFDARIMLVHSSAMRQSLAISVFLFAVGYIYKKQLFRYLCMVGIAMSFHMSAVILAPVYLLGVFNKKLSNLSVGLILGLFVSFLVFSRTIGKNITVFINAYMGKYGVYEEGAEIGTGLGLVFYCVVLACILYSCRLWRPKYALLGKLAMLSYLIMPLGLAILMVGRLGMYFQPLSLAVYPYVFMSINNSAAKNLLICLVSFVTLYLFYGFFMSDVWIDSFGTYQTIFSAPTIY